MIPNPFKVNIEVWDYSLAKKNCKHCFGRGWIGHNQKGNKVVCRCVVRAQRKGDKK